MKNTSITITLFIKEGVVESGDDKTSCQWKTYSTDKENIILLRVFMKNGITELIYDTTKEDFCLALKRAINQE